MYHPRRRSCLRRVRFGVRALVLGLLLSSACLLPVIAQDETAITEADDSQLIGTAALVDAEQTSAEAPSGSGIGADDLAVRLADVEKELKALKKKGEAEKKPKADEKKPDDAWLDMSTDKWTIKTGGHVQLDYINWAHADPSIRENAAAPGPVDYFEFRRLRLTADGTGYGVYDFRLQMTLEPENVSDAPGAQTLPVVKDAYFSINEVPWFGRLRIGNFFVPFSLEQVTNDTNNIFMERSIPTQGVFSADREVGIANYNCTADQRFTWSSGIFLDSISEAAKLRQDSNQGYRLSGRATWLPYYDEPSNGRYLVHTGIGILHTGDQDHSVRFRARPQIHLGPRIIDSGNLAADSYTTGHLEGAVVWGPVTLQSEAFLTSVNMIGNDTRFFSGAYAHLSYFLTGENRIFERFGQHGAQFGRNVPYNNVFAVPGAISLGAWEMKARWSNLNLNDTNKGQYNDLTVGFNWYWSDRTRVMFDWIHPVTSSTAVFGATTSDILATRFDFNW
jgi:phosphate-selective porin OprO/OprP